MTTNLNDKQKQQQINDEQKNNILKEMLHKRKNVKTI